MNYNTMVTDLLSTDQPIIPFDVTYRIHDDQGQFLGEVSAHKFILALASPIFRSAYFGSDNTDKKEKVIKSKDRTVKAFQAMVDFIYKKPVDFEQMTVHEIFDVVDLAECYMISDLMEVLKERLKTVKVTKDTVIEIAETAEKFERFEEASMILLTNCARTLNNELYNRESMVAFCSALANTDHGMTGLRLIAMTEGQAPVPCSNCQGLPCKSGTDIGDFGQIRIGTVMAPNPKQTYVGGIYDGIDFGRVRYTANHNFPATSSRLPMFRYSCGKYP